MGNMEEEKLNPLSEFTFSLERDITSLKMKNEVAQEDNSIYQSSTVELQIDMIL